MLHAQCLRKAEAQGKGDQGSAARHMSRLEAGTDFSCTMRKAEQDDEQTDAQSVGTRCAK